MSQVLFKDWHWSGVGILSVSTVELTTGIRSGIIDEVFPSEMQSAEHHKFKILT